MNNESKNVLAGLSALQKATEKVEKETPVVATSETTKEPEQTTVVETPETIEEPQQFTPQVVAPKKRASFFLRKGTSLTIPLTIPSFGEIEVLFENATTTVGPTVANALRLELQRNATLAQIVYEYDADDETVQAIVKHHELTAARKKGGSTGEAATLNTHGATEFRDPSLYQSQPVARQADELLRGKQATVGL